MNENLKRVHSTNTLLITGLFAVIAFLFTVEQASQLDSELFGNAFNTLFIYASFLLLTKLPIATVISELIDYTEANISPKISKGLNDLGNLLVLSFSLGVYGFIMYHLVLGFINVMIGP